MSCPNFKKYNAKHYYIIECEYESDCYDTMVTIKDELKAKCLGKYDCYVVDETLHGSQVPCDRSYGSAYICTIETRFNSKWNIYVHAMATDGYYSGVNFDYWFEIHDEVSGEVYNDLDEITNKSVVKRAETIGKMIEDTYKDYTDAYDCGGVFSNGEAVYCKIK